jgi:hypothetical protein
MPPLALLVLGAAQVVGATVPGTAPPTGRYYGQCTGVRVTASDRAVPPKNMTFSSRETLDLVLRPRLRQDFQGDHLMELKLFTPGGFLYQVIALPFVGAAAPNARGQQTAAAPPPPSRVVPGYPRPLDVQRLVPVRTSGTRGEYELRARLPVAGTSITLSSIYGTWSVQTFLDGQAEPCGPATKFTIRD